MITIASLISDDTNIIEIYLTNAKNTTENKININLSDEYLDKIKIKHSIIGRL